MNLVRKFGRAAARRNDVLRRNRRFIAVAGFAAMWITLAQSDSLLAVPIAPSSYTMLNGQTRLDGQLGDLPFWDKAYDGVGSAESDLASLSGGSGDLIDGVIASDNWDVVEDAGGNGPYVGWSVIDPPITFFFDDVVSIETLRIHADDADGAGGVSLPDEVTVVVNNTVMTFPIAEIGGAEPKWLEFDLGGLEGSAFVVIISRRDGDFALISEIEFEPVPEPTALALCFVGGLFVLGSRGRRRA